MNEATSERLQRLAQSAMEWAGADGFRALGPIAERHGSWEISFWRHGKDVDYVVSLAFTETRRKWVVELTAGAERGTRFVRKEVAQLQASPNKLDEPSTTLQVKALLREAIQVCTQLQESDLAESHLASRAK
jgi:hypothetical protein